MHRQFTKSLRRVVRKRGKRYVYSHVDGPNVTKYLNPDGSPSCLIAYALDDMKIAMSSYWDQSEIEKSAHTIMESLGFPESTCVAATIAQTAQDDGYTWGQALKKYKSSLKNKYRRTRA